MNKSVVIDSIVFQLQKSLGITLKAQKESEKASQESAPRMEARYDSRKEEMANLANAQSKQITETEKMIAYFKKLKEIATGEEVAEGSLVTLSNDQYYLVAKMGGGLTVEVESDKVSVVSLASMLGEQLLGKKVGDSVRVSGSQLEIRSISN